MRNRDRQTPMGIRIVLKQVLQDQSIAEGERRLSGYDVPERINDLRIRRHDKNAVTKLVIPYEQIVDRSR